MLRHSVLVLALVCGVGLPANLARADDLKGQPIYAKNNTNRTIYVAAHYVPPGGSSYVTNGFWTVNPGEKVLMLYNDGVYIYLHAHRADGAAWTGNTRVTIHGQTVNMFREDTGHGYEPWTYNFNP